MNRAPEAANTPRDAAAHPAGAGQAGGTCGGRKYLLLARDDKGNQTPIASSATLEEVLSSPSLLLQPRGDIGLSSSAAARLANPVVAGASPLTTGLEIVCTDQGEPRPRSGKPRYHFYVNTRAAGDGGDGSELAPWWGVDVAIAELKKRHRSGEIDLQSGQRLRLSHREVFAASHLERRKRIYEAIAKYVFMAMAMALVLPVLAILVYLVVKASPALSLSFILENPHNRMTAGGLWAPLIGTFFLVLLSLLVAAPVGILAGVYLNEYARDNWFTRIVNLAVMNLAGVPSIVHALFGVGAFVLFARMGRSLLAASCTLAVMTLPVIITSTREALAAVPMSFREACWNLGATRWQTIRTIVLPNSISGILTGVILQVSRAAGETAPILFTGAVFFVDVPDHGWASFFPYGLHDRCMALSMHLFTLLTQVRGVSEGVQYGTAVVLIALVLAVNSLAIGLRAYLRSHKKW
jgi:phosphate transport system permease protein